MTIKRMHGPVGPRWIASRIGELALTGDMEGVERFRSIAVRYEQMLAATSQ